MPPKVLLKKLLERFDIPFLDDPNRRYQLTEETFYNVEVRRDVQHRVSSMLLHWVSNYLFDFEETMLNELGQFSVTKLRAAGFQAIADAIVKCLKEGSRKFPWETFEEEYRHKAEHPSATSSEFDKLDVNVIVETLTHQDNRFYKAIRFTELLDQSWNKEKLRHKAPNIMRNINFLNHVSTWVSFTILNQEDTPNRVKVIQKFIRLLVSLIDINSFNMALAVHSGLSSASVYRLQEAWDGISENHTLRRDAASKLLSSENNSKRLREMMNKVYEKSEPCSPYIGIFLRDLVYVDDGNPTFIDGRINFLKCISTHALMHQILRFQERNYKLTPKTALLDEIDSCSDLDQDKLYEISLQVLPKVVNN
jgi:hypothetical protein